MKHFQTTSHDERFQFAWAYAGSSCTLPYDRVKNEQALTSVVGRGRSLYICVCIYVHIYIYIYKYGTPPPKICRFATFSNNETRSVSFFMKFHNKITFVCLPLKLHLPHNPKMSPRKPAVSIETKTFQLKRPGSKIQDPRFLRTLAEASWNPISWILPAIETFSFRLKRPVLDLGFQDVLARVLGNLGSWILDPGRQSMKPKPLIFKPYRVKV